MQHRASSSCRFWGGGYSSCNLYSIGHAEALKAAQIRRAGGQFVKFPRRLVPVVLPDGHFAIDVDKETTYAVTERILREREGVGRARPVSVEG